MAYRRYNSGFSSTRARFAGFRAGKKKGIMWGVAGGIVVMGYLLAKGKFSKLTDTVIGAFSDEPKG